MLRIVIITGGNRQVMEVDQAQFVRHCPYDGCRKEFETIDPDQIYCSETHRKMAWKLNNFGTMRGARLSMSTTIGLQFT